MKPTRSLLFWTFWWVAGGVAADEGASLALSGKPMTLRQVQEIARQNHPRIAQAQMQAQASQEAIVQAKSAFLPNIMQETVAAISNSTKQTPARLTAGWGFAPPPIASRVATGLTLKQLVTDFGRTSALVEGSELKAKASESEVQATDAQVLLLATNAYYQVFQSQEVLRIAEETLKARQLDLTRVKAMMKSGLTSSLDVSFAEVNLSDAQLLQIKAQNDLNSARAILSTAMGYREPQDILAKEEPMPPPVDNLDKAITEALYQRPDLQSVRLKLQAAEKFVEAEKAAALPNVQLVGNINYMPWINYKTGNVSGAYPQFNVIGGLVIDIPVFTGFELSARRDKAQSEARALSHGLTDAENEILRDVRVAWMASKTALERLAPAHQQLLKAQEAFRLAQSRYNLKLASIIELTQAQLNLTRAEIGELEARVDLQMRRAELDYQMGKLR
ncbi:TolC family protein [Candidatus Methylocalor cossyra]|uniref:Protein CyaE n=1 Tax=Candidatus Methylocalor cossyra TaxID=3108543 RepID=A0ABM9NMD2_9GAMM